MSASGVNYYYEYLGLPSGNMPAYYGANSITNPVSINASGALTDWTIICNFEKSGIKDGVIFSNFNSGFPPSGFVLGVTSNNRLYAESYSSYGPTVLIPDFTLGNKNIITASKAGDAVYFSCLNSNTRDLQSQDFSIPENSFMDSRNWTIGGFSNTPSYFSGNSFSGKINEFALFDISIRPDELPELVKGFYSNVTGDIPVEDPTVLSSLGMTNLSYLKPLTTGDISELFYAPNQYNVLSINLDADFDRVVGEFFADTDLNATGVYAYVNGVAQLGVSGFSTNGNVYNPIYSLSGDFVPSGNMFFANGQYNNQDRLVYDLNPVSFETITSPFSHNGASPQTITSLSTNPFVFFNGVKLVSGYDYTTLNNSVTFAAGNSLYNGASGTLSFAPNLSGFSGYSLGAFPNSLPNNFPRNTSILFVNGVRQNLSDSYVETSLFDKRNGTGVFPASTQMIFNNYSTFWNAI